MTRNIEPTQIDVKAYKNLGPYLTDLNPSNLYKQDNLLTGLPIEMQIFSSINSFYRYGYIVIYDESGARETNPLTANDIITINYRNKVRSLNDSFFSTIHFNIYDIEEIQMDPTVNNSKRYTGKYLKFHLVEAPFFLSYNDRTWKTAFGSVTSDSLKNEIVTKERIDKIFFKHIKNNLKLISDDTKNDFVELAFDEMSAEMHFVAPSWKSQKIFTYLLQYARDKNSYGNVKFWTTSNIDTGRPVLNLRSVNAMVKKPTRTPVVFTFLAEGDLSNKAENIGVQSLNRILSYTFKFYDLSTVTSGMAGGTLLNYDYKTGRYFKHVDSYTMSNEKKENAYLSNYGLWVDKIANTDTKQYYFGPMDPKEAENYLNNKINKNRYQLRCDIVTYCDEQIFPGDIIFCTFPSGTAEHSRGAQNNLFDDHMSDQWVVEDVVDILNVDGSAVRKMTIMKDAFFNMYGTSQGVEIPKFVPKVNSVFK